MRADRTERAMFLTKYFLLLYALKIKMKMRLNLSIFYAVFLICFFFIKTPYEYMRRPKWQLITTHSMHICPTIVSFLFSGCSTIA